jgi:hypothetical protein
LTAVSRPVLRKMLVDCRPTLIVVAGKSGRDTLEEMVRPTWHLTNVVSTGGKGGTYQWAAQRGMLNDEEITIVQLPHFSRANSSAQLYECAQWLSEVASGAGVVC